MKKTYKMFLALLLCALCGVSVKAEVISLQEVPFCTWNGWDANAQSTGEAECAWVIGEAGQLPYGDSNVNNYADLSNYTKLIITVSSGAPRILMNRDMDEGQWNATESESHLIDNTKAGWSDRYFKQEGNVYTVDLKLMAKEKGFAHLHAIKGANWADVVVESMEVERQAKAPVGWTDLIVNGNMEGEDVSCFFSKEAPASDPVNSVITDGVGKDESRGIVVKTQDKTANAWDSQFWFRFTEPVAAGTRYRVSFDYKADATAAVSTQAHSEPSDYIHHEMFGNLDFTPDWQTFATEGVVTADQSKEDKQFLSVAFNLNESAPANNYYFDNIKFEVFKLGTVAEFSNDVILIDFGFDTNIAQLVKQSGKQRLMYPMDCAKVVVNGSPVELYSVEGFADGRFYIFLQEAVDERDEVVVNFANPEDAAYRIIYTSGALNGNAVQDYNGVATNNPDVEDNDGYPYDYLTPTVMKAEPEDGSFNLPNGIKEFRLWFDKDVDCEKVKATLNGNALAVSPATGYASEITLVREGDDLATGEYTINVTSIYPKLMLADEIFGDTTYVINVGKPVINPDDVARELIPAEYFANTPANSIPEGYVVYFGEETRTAPNNYGSGSRTFDFAAGGDFTKGLYFRDKYTEYGSLEGYALTLSAGKKYNIHFNSAAWKDNGTWMKFQLLNENDDVVVEKVIKNAPNVNGSTAAVNGSTATVIKYIPEADGNYRLRWYPATGEDGAQGDFQEVLLANVGVKYIPNTAGIEWIQLLNTALENAKQTLDANQDERYNGADIDALTAAIQKYEAEMEGYTAPSAYQNAADALDAATQAVKDHRTLCDDYDTNIKKAIDVERQNREKKFAATELFLQLSEVNAKYHGTSEWVNVAESEEAEPVWQLVYSFDVLKDNDQLATAVSELKEIANTTSLLFTEGESKTSDTGVKVLVERIRLGAEGMKQLGVAADDELMVIANNALTDDDDIVEAIKKRITLSVYDSLKTAGNTMFKPVQDESTLEDIVPTYDLTVFAKNPNIYKQKASMDFNEENVPGWVTPEGFSKPGLSVGWGQPQGNDMIAEDCMFQTWGGSYRVEQTVTDLPAGVYTIKMGFGERMNSEEENFEDSYVYVKTTETPEGETGVTVDCPGIGQSFPYDNAVIENIVVTDGVLTFGVNAGPKSHTFFNQVRILMTGAAAGFDYANAYNEYVETGIETTKAGTVRAIELFDLNGRRLSTATRGVTIVKKYMSDGTVRTEKVVKK